LIKIFENNLLTLFIKEGGYLVKILPSLRKILALQPVIIKCKQVKGYLKLVFLISKLGF